MNTNGLWETSPTMTGLAALTTEPTSWTEDFLLEGPQVVLSISV